MMIDAETAEMMYEKIRLPVEPAWRDLPAAMQRCLLIMAQAGYVAAFQLAAEFVEEGAEIAMDIKTDPKISGILLFAALGIRDLGKFK